MVIEALLATDESADTATATAAAAAATTGAAIAALNLDLIPHLRSLRRTGDGGPPRRRRYARPAPRPSRFEEDLTLRASRSALMTGWVCTGHSGSSSWPRSRPSSSPAASR